MSRSAQENARMTVRGLLDESLMSQAKVVAGDDRIDAPLNWVLPLAEVLPRPDSLDGVAIYARPEALDRRQRRRRSDECKGCDRAAGRRRAPGRILRRGTAGRARRGRTRSPGRVRRAEPTARRAGAEPGSARDAVLHACARVPGGAVPPRRGDRDAHPGGLEPGAQPGDRARPPRKCRGAQRIVHRRQWECSPSRSAPSSPPTYPPRRAPRTVTTPGWSGSPGRRAANGPAWQASSGSARPSRAGWSFSCPR